MSVLRDPSFITRRALLRHIARLAAQVMADGRPCTVIDVGCGSKPYRHLFPTEDYIGVDVVESGHPSGDKCADRWFDGRTLPFEDESVDGVLCTQVLEHAEDAPALIGEISRVLRPGGWAIITAPFVWPEHELPYDFRRYTTGGLLRALGATGLEITEARPTTGSHEALAQVLSTHLHASIGAGMPVWSAAVTALLCAPVQLFGMLAQAVFPDRTGIYLDTAVLARKTVPGAHSEGSSNA